MRRLLNDHSKWRTEYWKSRHDVDRGTVIRTLHRLLSGTSSMSTSDAFSDWLRKLSRYHYRQITSSCSLSREFRFDRSTVQNETSSPVIVLLKRKDWMYSLEFHGNLWRVFYLEENAMSLTYISQAIVAVPCTKQNASIQRLKPR